MDYPIIVPLKKPVTQGETTIDSLTFDELSLRQSIELDRIADASDRTVYLLAAMASVEQDVILDLREQDFTVILEQVLKPREQRAAMVSVPVALLEKIPTELLEEFDVTIRRTAGND